MDAICHERRKDPGPQHKYKIQHDFLKPTTPFYVNFAKSQDRFKVEKPLAKKAAGPATYHTESAISKLSTHQKVTVNIPISGIGVVDGSKSITHQSKLKVKSTRYLDLIIKNATKKGSAPGVGHYKNLEKAMDKRSPLPMSLKIRRH